MSNHIKEITAKPLTKDNLDELHMECEGVVKDREHDSFVRLEAMKVIHKIEEAELKVGSEPDEETLEVMNFFGWFSDAEF